MSRAGNVVPGLLALSLEALSAGGQLFRLVFAMTLEKIRSIFLLLREGQTTDPLSRSFRLKVTTASLPHIDGIQVNT